MTYGNAQGRVVFTQDEDYFRIHTAGVAHPGVVYARQQTRTIGQIIGSLVLIWELLEPEEMANRVEFI